MELEDIEAGGAGAPNRRSIRFDVSQLKCGKKQGTCTSTATNRFDVSARAATSALTSNSLNVARSKVRVLAQQHPF